MKALAFFAEWSRSRACDDEDLQSVLELGERWVAAVNAGDVEQIVALVADDVVLLPANMPTLKGKLAVETMYREFFGQFKVEQYGETEEVRVSDDWAFGWGTDFLTLIPAKGGRALRVRGKVMSIMQRQADGVWKFARAISNVS